MSNNKINEGKVVPGASKGTAAAGQENAGR